MRDIIAHGFVRIEKIPIEENPSDMITKVILATKFRQYLNLIRIVRTWNNLRLGSQILFLRSFCQGGEHKWLINTVILDASWWHIIWTLGNITINGQWKGVLTTCKGYINVIMFIVMDPIMFTHVFFFIITKNSSVTTSYIYELISIS